MVRVRGQRQGRDGYTLVEVMTVALIMVLLASIAAPSFRCALEQTRADIAGANLRAIWAAERLYWLKYRKYTGSVDALRGTDGTSEKLLDLSLPFSESEIGPSNPSPYLYSITPSSDGSSFTACAVRSSYRNSNWTGMFVIDQDGQFVRPDLNNVTDGGGAHIVPGFR